VRACSAISNYLRIASCFRREGLRQNLAGREKGVEGPCEFPTLSFIADCGSLFLSIIIARILRCVLYRRERALVILNLSLLIFTLPDPLPFGARERIDRDEPIVLFKI